MQLHRLTIYKNNEILRTIPFKKGLNLIINSDSDSAKTGNSVGKSTASRLLDYLFLSSGEDIYTESEFGKIIPEVSNFIIQNYILVELEALGFDNKNHKIARQLTLNPKESNFYLDGIAAGRNSYLKFVSAFIFGQNSDKPSIRNLAHKFIRNTNEKMQNTTKFLHLNTKPDVYDQVYLFLFGFGDLDLLKEKANINNQLSTKAKHLAAYRNPFRESSLQKMITPLETDEDDLKNRIASFNFKGSQESSVRELVHIQRQISDLTIEYSKTESRISYLVHAVEKLKGNETSINGKELYEIYANAGVSISGELKRSYDELIIFHDKILANKVNLIESDIDICRSRSNSLRLEIDNLHEAESRVFKDIKEPGALKSIGQMYNDLSLIREKIAGIKALLDKIEVTKDQIASLDQGKAKIIDEISKRTEKLDSNVELFNKYFGSYSKVFYGERFIFDLMFDLEKEKCRFDIACVTPNPTGGKKKGELSAFDLAYIDFVNEARLKRPTFVVHDSIEDVDVNQVLTIFESANRINGQYIVSLLSDKIADPKFDIFRLGSVILELSEDDKFFRI